jgi:hypothetical protein
MLTLECLLQQNDYSCFHISYYVLATCGAGASECKASERIETWVEEEAGGMGRPISSLYITQQLLLNGTY